MKVFRTTKGFVIYNEGNYYLSRHSDWDIFINRENLFFELQREIQKLEPDYDYKDYTTQHILPPIKSQEVWGIIKNSPENSVDCRPNLFFKSTGQRVVGTNQSIKIRRDAKQHLPEPNLTLFINSNKQISGYTIGNDISSTDLLESNPLYLSQAKIYDKSMALGACIWVLGEPLSDTINIGISIKRSESTVFSKTMVIENNFLNHKKLVNFLYKETSFAHGCFLMTGNCVLFPPNFGLCTGDEIKISIEGIGTLVNIVE